MKRKFKGVCTVLFLALVICTLSGCASNEEYISTSSENTFRLADRYTLDELNMESKVDYATDIIHTTFDIDLSFAGDCMLATYKGGYAEGSSLSWYAKNKPYDYFFKNMLDIFEADDLTIVNLENVLTYDMTLAERPKPENPAYWYKAPEENVNILLASSIEVANLANNHTYDYFERGDLDTKDILDKAGVDWGDSGKTYYYEKDGFKIALICHGLWYGGQVNEIINRVKDAEDKADYIIVYFHGGTERIHAPEDWKIEACHKMVDAGVDLVIGNHPHVLQPMEEYNGVKIIYSMGNFCFGGSAHPENRTIVYKVKLTIDKNTNEVCEYTDEIVPCYVYNEPWQPDIIKDEQIYQNVMDFMNWKRTSPL